ncbi:ABC transporter G family member 38-like isoform X1 [Rhodamnia argentea]|uniref:ABC transporter G family member 38-like isoform X1 n=1 Tax=Rhodamnia argentea TaxID=178133 RepID=A0A8B8QS06_9MYRT|nr:ABC transporter G family member 38-like isoform X1 [Rhodamnia argentea]
MTLLLGPPGSGKTTLLKALTGKRDPELNFSGEVTYNGHKMHEFVPERTAAYICQYDVHIPQMTVRETLAFSAKCQGAGSSYDMLTELLRREKLLKIKPDPYIDALMKASVLKEHKEDIVTDYVLRILGLEVCANTMIGNEMMRGISGGQKKRVTTGEMLVSPVNALFMDNISTGLDSSTTFQIVNSIRQSIHIFNKTALVSLLQPPPETYELFDDIILLSEGQIVYQGPRECVLEFFESMGFRCPDRKGVADYLQEVTSRKDQRQYWVSEESLYRYIPVAEFVEAFKSFHVGRANEQELRTPFDRSKNHAAALAKSKYGASKRELLKACLSREATLMRRDAYLHKIQILQIWICSIILATVFGQARKQHDSVEDGTVHLGALYFLIHVILFAGFLELPNTIDKLPVFYKQRDLHFYPSWAFSLPSSILWFPLSIIEVALAVGTAYYIIGFDPSVIRLLKQYMALVLSGQMSFALFRCTATLSRDHVIANTAGSFAMVWVLTFGGFILSQGKMKKWLIWGFWTSPLMYTQTAISVNEFLGESWSHALEGTQETLGIAILRSHGLFTDPSWYWISLGALIGFIVLLNVVSTLALSYLNQYGRSQAIFMTEDVLNEKQKTREDGKGRERTLLPFTPLSLTFENVTYSVDMPGGFQNSQQNRLTLLNGVSGAFRPGVLTALMGVSGAGKTTLLDVLAGRKNSGYIEGDITISGHQKEQETFARISGYCEQEDIHSPFVTVYESLLYSAWLRLPPETDSETRELFIEEVMDLIELTPLRNALVGISNLNGLLVEQRKRLTIAVELVTNPSIIFMDEPTSGLDARAAALVMRTIRSTVDMGRTVVCTIHQPSLEIFESFDELILLTWGGREIYAGPLGPQCRTMIAYFESIPGVERVGDNTNPANWVLEVTARAREEILGVEFADEYKRSELYRRNEALIRELSSPSLDSHPLSFPSKYSRSFLSQFKVCLWKQHKSYWRNVSYTAARFVFTVSVAVVFGILFWDLGSKRSSRQDILNGVGALFTTITFMGTQSVSLARPVIVTERTVYYRERAAGMYSAFPYAMAQVAIEIPYTLLQVVIHWTITFAMTGYEWTATRFFLNLFFLFISILYFLYFGMMIIAVSPNQVIAATSTGTFYSMWTLFSGVVIPRTRIAVWWRWYTWLCPVSWSIYGMVTAQYGDMHSKLDSGETVAEYLRDYFGFRYDFLWVVSVVLIGFVLLFVSVYSYAMKALNFQKR